MKNDVRMRKPGGFRQFLEDTGQAAGLAEHGLSITDLDLGGDGVERKKIVVVSTEPEFCAALMRHSLGVAGRLGTEVVALSVCGQGAPGEGGHESRAAELFEVRALRSAQNFGRLAEEQGVTFRHGLRFGKPSEVVEAECTRLRRVEFVLAMKEPRGTDGFHLSMPLFEVVG